MLVMGTAQSPALPARRLTGRACAVCGVSVPGRLAGADEICQVLPYQLCLGLADVQRRTDTPDTRHRSGGQVSGEQVGRLMPVAVERGTRLGYGLRYGGLGYRPC